MSEDLGPGYFVLPALDSLLLLCGIIVSIAHAKYSRWPMMIALGIGIQALLMAYFFLPFLWPELLTGAWGVVLLGWVGYGFWAGMISILAIVIGVGGLVSEVHSRPAHLWAGLVGFGAVLHLSLNAALEMASRARWHATRYGRPLGVLDPVMSWGHAAAQLAIIVGVIGTLSQLRRIHRSIGSSMPESEVKGRRTTGCSGRRR